MARPRFTYIPVMTSPARAVVRIAEIEGYSTRHGDVDAGRGTLFGTVTKSGGLYTLALYPSPQRSGQAVLAGTCAAVGEWFNLAGDTMGGRAILDSYESDETELIAVVSFAVDSDVYSSDAAASSLPGWDGDYGLAELHAQAMRQIIADALPAAMPHVFGGDGLSEFVPGLSDSMPDLRTIASAGQLRIAQSALVKAMASEQKEHLEDFAQMATLARERYDATMERLKAANVPREQETEREATGAKFGIGVWARG